MHYARHSIVTHLIWQHVTSCSKCAGAVDTAIAAYLVKCKLSLEVDEQPAIAEEVVEAGLGFHEGMHWRV